VTSHNKPQGKKHLSAYNYPKKLHKFISNIYINKLSTGTPYNTTRYTGQLDSRKVIIEKCSQ